jgi:hypothetical protein
MCGLNLIFPICKPFHLGFSMFFGTQKPMSLAQKLGPIPCAHFTFPNATNLMGTKYYNMLK